MTRRLLFTAPAIALLASACPLRSGDPAGEPAPPDAYRGPGLAVQLVSEVTAIHPGQPFWAGLFIRHEPGFHTYWKNPGKAGVPTKITWKLPDGWQAGPLIYPPPDKVKMAIYNTHGYEHDVLLITEITPSQNATSGRMDAEVVWMCCGATCHPGYRPLGLTLPVKNTAKDPELDKAWHARFEEARAAQPPPAEGWTFTAVREGEKITLTGKPPPGVKTPAKPQFFSGDNLICSDSEQVWTADADGGFSAALPVYEFPPPETSRLSGLLAGKAGWQKDGKAPYVEISVPVTGAPVPDIKSAKP